MTYMMVMRVMSTLKILKMRLRYDFCVIRYNGSICIRGVNKTLNLQKRTYGHPEENGANPPLRLMSPSDDAGDDAKVVVGVLELCDCGVMPIA